MGASHRRCGYCISRNRHVHVAPAYRLQMARPALGPGADIVVLDNDWQMVVVTARGQWQHGARASWPSRYGNTWGRLAPGAGRGEPDDGRCHVLRRVTRSVARRRHRSGWRRVEDTAAPHARYCRQGSVWSHRSGSTRRSGRPGGGSSLRPRSGSECSACRVVDAVLRIGLTGIAGIAV